MPIETRSLPTLTRSYPRRFTFYVADPISSIRRGHAAAMRADLPAIGSFPRISEISRALFLPFAIHARFQELKQPFFLFQRQCIRSCFDFSQRAHDGRLPLRGGACEEKVRDGEDTIGNTRRLRQGYGEPRRRACSPDQIAVAAATATTTLALFVAKKSRRRMSI